MASAEVPFVSSDVFSYLGGAIAGSERNLLQTKHSSYWRSTSGLADIGPNPLNVAATRKRASTWIPPQKGTCATNIWGLILETS